MGDIIPNQENLIIDNEKQSIYWYCDDMGIQIHKSKEIQKQANKFIFYPFYLREKQILFRKVKTIELRGWNRIEDIPKDFNLTGRYGFSTKRIKILMGFLYRKFPNFNKLVVGKNISTRFSDKTITFNWGDLEPILKLITKESNWLNNTLKLMINNYLSEKTTKLSKERILLKAGQLDAFLCKFDSFEKVSKSDVESLSTVMETAPPSKISVTSNFIKTRDKINRVFIDDIILKFKNLMSSKNDNELQWQNFFANNSWILNHLFPFEVILKQQQAYVGGKTFKNTDGRIVDFLFQNGFTDNFALLEIKTHKKSLLKQSPYREPDAYAYSDDLSGGISQCLDQKDTFIKSYGNEAIIMNPKTLLIIGMKSNLNENQSKCFELLRSNQKDVDIITFDELLAKLNGLIKVVSHN